MDPVESNEVLSHLDTAHTAIEQINDRLAEGSRFKRGIGYQLTLMQITRDIRKLHEMERLHLERK